MFRMYREFIFSAAILTNFVSAARAGDPDHCHLQLATQLDIQYDDANIPTVTATFAGKDKRLILDTGGVYSMLTEATVADLGLTKNFNDKQIYMIDGKPLYVVAVGRDITIGRLNVPKFFFIVMPNDKLARDVAGSIAPDILHQFDVDLDFGGKKLNLFSQDHCPGKVVYWTDQGDSKLPFTVDEVNHIAVRATLDGHSVDVSVDTGSTVSIMTMTRAEKLFGIKKGDPLLKILPEQKINGMPAYTYPFKSLDLNGVAVQNPNILLYENQLGSIDTDDVIMGMTVLRQLHLYIAYREKALYVTPANANKP
jgi:predicted aspartyl protease